MFCRILVMKRLPRQSFARFSLLQVAFQKNHFSSSSSNHLPYLPKYHLLGESEIEIKEISPQEVYNYILDYTHIPYYFPGVVSVDCRDTLDTGIVSKKYCQATKFTIFGSTYVDVKLITASHGESISEICFQPDEASVLAPILQFFLQPLSPPSSNSNPDFSTNDGSSSHTTSQKEDTAKTSAEWSTKVTVRAYSALKSKWLFGVARGLLRSRCRRALQNLQRRFRTMSSTDDQFLQFQNQINAYQQFGGVRAVANSLRQEQEYQNVRTGRGTKDTDDTKDTKDTKGRTNSNVKKSSDSLW